MNTTLLINILILTGGKNKIVFKFSDEFTGNIFGKPYKEISSYLNNKFKPDYFNNTKMKKKNFKKEKKVLRIRMVGLYEVKFHHEWLKKKLEDEFIVKFVKNYPDYFIYNVKDSKDRTENPPWAIRIAFYTENMMPDINYADYSMAHYHINYLDRYFKTNIFFYENLTQIQKIREEVLNKPMRTKFCGAVISNCGGE